VSVAGSQQRTFLRLVGQLRPHWRSDAALPSRIQSLLAAHREFGARDRRLYRELIYTTLRFLPWIEPLLEPQPDEAARRVAWLAAETPATRAFRAAFASGDFPRGDPAELLPAWFRDHCPELFTSPELDAQLRRAPLWLRLQTDDPKRVHDEFAGLGWSWRPSAVLADALEVKGDVDVTRSRAWMEGLVEVQDLGSQLILASVGVEPGGRWLDACAGAGGKTLQLARLVGRSGQIDAHDIRPAALAELRIRVARAGISHVRTRAQPDAAGYDGVLVDAPCSGTGTWRRAPHLKWVTTETQVARAAETQRALLRQFSAFVRPGGRLVYATVPSANGRIKRCWQHFSPNTTPSPRNRLAAPSASKPAPGELRSGPPATTPTVSSPHRCVDDKFPCRVPAASNHRPTVVPDSDYRIKLQVFEGPLDLLLFLIRKNELDIYDIPIESVTRQYIDALHAMQQLDLDVAGEFFVMAATLMEI
jgi:16S rRNA (cytosine967-C5)-methyltransferase